MNVELRRQHEEHIARRFRMSRPVCRAIPSPCLRSEPEPIIEDYDAHVRAFLRHTALATKIPSPSLRLIVAAVSLIFGVSVNVIRSDRRRTYEVNARHAVWWLAREMTELSFNHIGRALKRDHSTIIHGCELFEKKITTDRELHDLVTLARTRIERETNRLVRDVLAQ